MSNLKSTKRQSWLALIADDDPYAIDLVTTALDELGLRFVFASDGAEAVRLCGQQLPDIAILDGVMPQMRGTEVCSAIKSMPGGEYVPVMVLTALDSVNERVRALDGGADDYLIKPYHLEELRARVTSLLRIRELTLSLIEKNAQLTEVQEIMLQQERQLVVSQLAGTAAHQLGQPITAMLLNCHLLNELPKEDSRAKKALEAITLDLKRMSQLIEKLKDARAAKTEVYHSQHEILEIE